MQPQPLFGDPGIGQVLASQRLVQAPGGLDHRPQRLEVEQADLSADRQAFVHQRRQCHLPACADRSQPLVIGYTHVGKEDFVELAVAVHLADGPHLDPWALHVDEEHRQSSVLGHGGVGARKEQAEVGELRARGPDLLAVDHPVVAFRPCPGENAGNVRAGRRFAEHLAPDFLAIQTRPDAVRLVRFAAVGHQGGQAHAQADLEDAETAAKAALFLAHDQLLHRRAAQATQLSRPGDRCIAGSSLPGLPGAGCRQTFVRGQTVADEVACVALGFGVGFEPCAHFSAKGGLGGGVVKVHRGLLAPQPST